MAFLLAVAPRALAQADMQQVAHPTSGPELVTAFLAANAAADVNQLAALVYWHGISPSSRNTWKAHQAWRIGRPILGIDFAAPDAATAARNYSLPLTAVLRVEFDMSDTRSATTVSLTQTSIYPVGFKDGVCYILLPK